MRLRDVEDKRARVEGTDDVSRGGAAGWLAIFFLIGLGCCLGALFCQEFVQ